MEIRRTKLKNEREMKIKQAYLDIQEFIPVESEFVLKKTEGAGTIRKKPIIQKILENKLIEGTDIEDRIEDLQIAMRNYIVFVTDVLKIDEELIENYEAEIEIKTQKLEDYENKTRRQIVMDTQDKREEKPKEKKGKVNLDKVVTKGFEMIEKAVAKAIRKGKKHPDMRIPHVIFMLIKKINKDSLDEDEKKIIKEKIFDYYEKMTLSKKEEKPNVET